MSDATSTERAHLNGAIVMVGAPGSGKTTVGKLLAAQIGWEFVDVDSIVEAQAGRTIAEIFVEDGEPAFRHWEETVTCNLLQTMLDEEGAVLSLGGGSIMSTRVRTALAGHDVIWLQVQPGTAAERVGLNTARPLLLGNVRGTLIKLLKERLPLYSEVATIRVATDDLTADEVTAEIIGKLPL